MAILVSGGAGYIGSHTCIELLNAGFDIVVADNYYNASPVVLDRVKQITGKDFRFYKADMTKHEDVEHIFSELYAVPAGIRRGYFKVKVLELLLFLSALDVAHEKHGYTAAQVRLARAARDALLHTMACKAAIKGGWKSDLSELRVLVDKVQSGEVQFCPHGRPVKAKLTKYELEKMFKRA